MEQVAEVRGSPLYNSNEDSHAKMADEFCEVLLIFWKKKLIKRRMGLPNLTPEEEYLLE